MPELTLVTICTIIVCSFLFEYMDSTLGMGYGTTLTPIFLLMGFEPIDIVPAVLLSELISGIMAAFFHHKEGNVNLKPENIEELKVIDKLDVLGYISKVKKSLPTHLKVALLLSLCSIVGTISAVFVSISIPKFWLKMYIGVLVLSMGVLILICFAKNFKFTWRKVTLLGLIASFNKGLSGGGYGPVVTSGQILSGVESKSAIGITSLAEGLTCLVGVIMYLVMYDNPINFKFAACIIAGAVFSVPLSAKSVKFISNNYLKLAIAILTIILGAFTIIKAVKSM